MPDSSNQQSDQPRKKVLILGGYGTFGSRIAHRLANEPGLHLIIAGRDRFKAELFASRLHDHPSQESLQRASAEGIQLDRNSADFANQINRLNVDLLIHCAGPFYGQDYGVAEACIAQACDYIDIAESAAFVCNIDSLDASAREAGTTVISGAGTLPALSSAVLAALTDQFSRIDGVSVHISPARQIRDAHATQRSGFDFLGDGFQRIENGQQQDTYSGNYLQRVPFGHPVGPRWVCDYEAPDQRLIPQHFPGLRSLQTTTGLQPAPLQFGLAACANIAHRQFPIQREALRKQMAKVGHWLADHWPMRSANGGMMMEIEGVLSDQESGRQGAGAVQWQILGLNGDGPWIPAAPAAALARKLLIGGKHSAGARPCWQQVSLNEILEELTPYSVVSMMEVEPQG
ncbi:saccharopine dehydrogenase NADP-binding domain-containing protein [Microbulbifer sp.]|uniref:saccharopine dehydrogenase family protein n=1 Tax=Microbulbifer sp. TaxID=1908541 RepID=UPI0025907227|nr:saccharopine dehydrogenase NADP-binding domain-containing protein [Microbulbifer sp.]